MESDIYASSRKSSRAHVRAAAKFQSQCAAPTNDDDGTKSCYEYKVTINLQHIISCALQHRTSGVLEMEWNSPPAVLVLLFCCALLHTSRFADDDASGTGGWQQKAVRVWGEHYGSCRERARALHTFVRSMMMKGFYIYWQ